MTLGELVDSSARPINVLLHSRYQPIYSVNFPSGATLSRPFISRWTLYFVQLDIKVPLECVV